MKYHEPVMVREVLDHLHIKKGFYYIDATLGTGGHSLAIIKAGGVVLGIEEDPEILAVAKERLLNACPTPKLVLGNFADLDKIANRSGWRRVSGILFDLGVNNLHLTDNLRGFSFQNLNAPLDMRLNPSMQKVTAADLVNALDKTQLTNLFSRVMKYPDSKKLAKRVVDGRPIKSVGDLEGLIYGLHQKVGLNRLTLPMLALRMAVNSELENLAEALPKALRLLVIGGKLIVISFHSAEDLLVKQLLGKNGELVMSGVEEINKNPRARSAKMRIYTKE